MDLPAAFILFKLEKGGEWERGESFSSPPHPCLSTLLICSENLREVDVKKHTSHTPAKIHYFFF